MTNAVVGKLLRGEVEDYLKDHFGIEASTHNGFLFFSDGAANTYKKRKIAYSSANYGNNNSNRQKGYS